MATAKPPTPTAALASVEGFVAALLAAAVALDSPEDAPLRRRIAAVEPTLRRGGALLRAHLEGITDALDAARHHEHDQDAEPEDTATTTAAP